jgi:hypothetical protein
MADTFTLPLNRTCKRLVASTVLPSLLAGGGALFAHSASVYPHSFTLSSLLARPRCLLS